MPQAPNVSFRPLCLNASQGYWVNLLKVTRAGVLSRHRHTNPVHGYVIKGRWHYLEHDWVATEGGYVYEPPGETHTLVVPDDVEEMITLFQVNGLMLYVDPWGKPTGYEDVFTKIDMCRKHYTACGLGVAYVDQFIRWHLMARSVSGPEIERLIQLLAKLPGLGPRSARRAALHLIDRKEELLVPLAKAMEVAVERIVVCSTCGNIDTSDPCMICATRGATRARSSWSRRWRTSGRWSGPAPSVRGIMCSAGCCRRSTASGRTISASIRWCSGWPPAGSRR